MDSLLNRLDEASYAGDISSVKVVLQEDRLLLDRVLTEVRDNPLHIAALHGHVDFASEVLRLKPELATRLNREGLSPLHLAAARGHLQIVEKLLDHAENNICHIREIKYGYMPVHMAAINAKHEVLKMLVERCKETLDMVTARKETLLHLATMANCPNSVSYLIARGIDINAMDDRKNTCLHLAVAKSNYQVIEELLDQEAIEVNSVNEMDLTPLDILLVTSWHSNIDVSLVNMLRKAGGVEATELRNPESNHRNSFGVGNQSNFSSRNKCRAEANQGDANTLLVVATLVATMTFPAISNPPGGFIQLPFNKGDDTDSTWYLNWMDYDTFPAGRPVLLWRLKAFFVLVSVALFSSISVILILLCMVPKRKIVMKFLVAVVWLAAFCTALAYASAFLAIYKPLEVRYKDYYDKLLDRIKWIGGLLSTWFALYLVAGSWASVRVINLLWRRGGFKGKLPNRVGKVGLAKGSNWFKPITSLKDKFRKIIFIILMVCVAAVFGLTTWGIYVLFDFVQY
ncbi:hypothetical protein LUZ63_012076 [Rhynchospora breviuscula]|uniref:PGG domain-containing protein n=1 Tax=Rhynchospora breviuscula TaxID=2022672 RepID=A0A9Q0CK39_9POAL|nr:hypothetical protein LUZ63_012076 [Rhynchospora breviuscula]